MARQDFHRLIDAASRLIDEPAFGITVREVEPVLIMPGHHLDGPLL